MPLWSKVLWLQGLDRDDDEEDGRRQGWKSVVWRFWGCRLQFAWYFRKLIFFLNIQGDCKEWPPYVGSLWPVPPNSEGNFLYASGLLFKHLWWFFFQTGEFFTEISSWWPKEIDTEYDMKLKMNKLGTSSKRKYLGFWCPTYTWGRGGVPVHIPILKIALL